MLTRWHLPLKGAADVMPGFDVAELRAPSRAIPTEINSEWKCALRIDSTLLYILKLRYLHNPKLRRHLIFIFWLHFTAECRLSEILDQSSLWRCIKVNDRFGRCRALTQNGRNTFGCVRAQVLWARGARVECNYILEAEHVQLKGKYTVPFEVLSQKDIGVQSKCAYASL